MPFSALHRKPGISGYPRHTASRQIRDKRQPTRDNLLDKPEISPQNRLPKPQTGLITSSFLQERPMPLPTCPYCNKEVMPPHVTSAIVALPNTNKVNLITLSCSSCSKIISYCIDYSESLAKIANAIDHTNNILDSH